MAVLSIVTLGSASWAWTLRSGKVAVNAETIIKVTQNVERYFLFISRSPFFDSVLVCSLLIVVLNPDIYPMRK